MCGDVVENGMRTKHCENVSSWVCHFIGSDLNTGFTDLYFIGRGTLTACFIRMFLDLLLCQFASAIRSVIVLVHDTPVHM